VKPIAVTTVAQARALPEVAHADFDERRRILDADEAGGRKGDTLVERVVRPYCPTPTDGKQILLFIDSDGRSMRIVYTPTGPAKTPVLWWAA
jgi:hypothetical protein